MKDSPALEVRFPPLAADSDLPDRLLALLDDLQPIAIDEGTCAPGAEAAPPTCWRVHFASRETRDRAAPVLAAAFGASGVGIGVLDVEDEGWVERSQAMLSAVRVGRLVVAPPWDVPSGAGETVVVVRPSAGFGTGHHASTRTCLRALQQLDLAGRYVIDVGTGSGVLAIAAVRLGAARAVAIDCDPDALASARENVALNGVAAGVALVEADLVGPALPGIEPADIVLANITAAVLVRSAGTLGRLVVPGGSLVAGGVMHDQADEVVRALEAAAGMSLVRQDEEDGWLALTFRAAPATRRPIRTAESRWPRPVPHRREACAARA